MTSQISLIDRCCLRQTRHPCEQCRRRDVRQAPLDLKPEEWNAAIALNLTSVFLCSQAAARIMMDLGGGRIINVSSVAGIRMSPGFVHYGAAKAGVINLTKSLASCGVRTIST
ncbi:MAG: hypothetical protein Ct9H300mP8_04350 [Gammaproteobacteria bacterium]|nr:MAG: hypothetical protein Ct9H300mP8_04350 [Gammaproteobacteria bacterium]